MARADRFLPEAEEPQAAGLDRLAHVRADLIRLSRAIPDSRPVALVIEDDEQILSLLQFILGREDFAIEVAREGRAAQTCIEQLAPPAIVTLDVMLPYVDGFQLLARMRARPGWETVPVILLTSKSQEKDIVRALDGGASDYLVKPFKPEELRARVRRLVRR